MGREITGKNTHKDTWAVVNDLAWKRPEVEDNEIRRKMLKDRPMELGPERVGVFVSGRCPWERWPAPAEALNKQINGMNSPSRGRPASLLIYPAPAQHAHAWRSAWKLLMGTKLRISFTKSVMDRVLLMSNLTLAMLEHEPLLWENKIS